ncbi:hypothetical protein pEaSNUABM35_00328 [Erwinia phage pEa_SNUABM_35]|uniref:Uncharacterized protein n=1 Tax=Erwinia phage pEa_SNUABM_35 TaxID=2869557 RepID=A0AAE7XQY6_9CAUD|nr:hypothetical protein MPK65_gp328 [Erwinia phage pEa_SNUABM_35]QZE60245.1 hypothetical protein pEaSNUABM35_00328 [Erwinia phage pEa_SNUABM_35]QZE60581.1 hypothetical protein pEaSNUABM36_00328 [Erwinia phage pEa_SNUABM_36]
MTQKLSEQINRYFNLMEKIREQLFRVLNVSDRYLCIVSFNTQHQAMQCDLVSRESLLPAKLLEGLSGQELVVYGTITAQIEKWVADGMSDDFPITQDADTYAQYRKLVDPEQEPAISDANLAEHVASLPKSDALKYVDPLSKYELAIICKAWGLEQDASETVMLSLVKGYILRRDS